MKKNDDLKLWHITGGMLLGMVAISLMMCGCKQVEYVPVVQTNTEHHWHTDSVIHQDSVVKESLITVMQLDSAAMAKYGIQLKQAERAWMVKTTELERQIERMMQLSASRDTVRDSVPVPYPVKEYVQKPLAWHQKTLMTIGLLTLMAIIIICGRWLSKHPPFR